MNIKDFAIKIINNINSLEEQINLMSKEEIINLIKADIAEEAGLE